MLTDHVFFIPLILRKTGTMTNIEEHGGVTVADTIIEYNKYGHRMLASGYNFFAIAIFLQLCCNGRRQNIAPSMGDRNYSYSKLRIRRTDCVCI